MRKLRYKSSILALVLVVAVQAAGAAPATSSTPTPVKQARETRSGQDLWRGFSCDACHGGDAQGGIAGPSLVAPLMPFEQLEAIVRRPYGSMPAYSPKVLSHEQLRIIYEHLNTKNTQASSARVD